MGRIGSLLAVVGVAMVGMVGVGAPAPALADGGRPADERERCPAERVLAQPPFPPTDVNLFTPETYAQASPMVPAPPRQITEAGLRAQLAQMLQARAARHPGAVEEGLAVFDDPQIEKIIPDPNLRAALASLVASPAAASIDTIRSGLYTEVVFADLDPSAIAEVRPPGPRILFNQRYQYEDFRLLGVTMAHETLHQDPNVSPYEELIAYALHTPYYGQLLLEQPALATSGTELSRRNNTALLALLNTRDANGRQSLTANRGNVFPGGKPLANFRSIFQANLGEPTPGNANLDFFLGAMTETRQNGANFNQATVDLLDSRLLWATPQGRLRVAELLQLKLPAGCPPWPTPKVPTQIPAGDRPAGDLSAAGPARHTGSAGPTGALAATAVSAVALLRLRRRASYRTALNRPRRRR